MGKSKGKVKVGSRVSNKENFRGTVSGVDVADKTAVVIFDSMAEDEVIQSIESLTTEEDTDYTDIDASINVHPSQPGFCQYAIEWRSTENKILKFNRPHSHEPFRAVRFRTHAQGVTFYGGWRKTSMPEGDIDLGEMFAVDVYARWNDKFYQLPPMGYEVDPRLVGFVDELEGEEEVESQYSGMRELNGDICTAINRWLFFHAGGNIETVSDIRTRADHPMLSFSSFQDLRDAIMAMTDLYNKSAKNGGLRSVVIKGSTDSSPGVLIQANLTSSLVNNGFKPDAPPVSDMPPREEAASSPDAGGNTTVTLSGSVKELQAKLKSIQLKPKRDRSPGELSQEKKLRQLIRQKKQ